MGFEMVFLLRALQMVSPLTGYQKDCLMESLLMVILMVNQMDYPMAFLHLDFPMESQMANLTEFLLMAWLTEYRLDFLMALWKVLPMDFHQKSHSNNLF